jgi:thiamine biosynthesis lipoprotein
MSFSSDIPNELELSRQSEWHEPVMGTAVDIQVVLDGAGRDREAKEIIQLIVQEMLRLQQILSSVDPSSEFSRWLHGDIECPSPELSVVLSMAVDWHRASNGRFNPQTEAFTTIWSKAERIGVRPSDDELDALVASTTDLSWFRDPNTGAWQPGPEKACTLNAMAKGWVIDAASDFGHRTFPVRSLTINAGGDVRRSGLDPLIIGIENPFRPYDNEPPIAAVRIENSALATSGSARKGFLVGKTRYGHVIDPRTGWPIDAIASISVVADSAADADVLATILGVESPSAAIAEAQQNGIAAFIVTSEEQLLRSDVWIAIEIDLSEH